MNFELSGGRPRGASALSIVVLSLFIVCFCYVSLFNVLYAVLYEVGSNIELLSSLGPLQSEYLIHWLQYLLCGGLWQFRGDGSSRVAENCIGNSDRVAREVALVKSEAWVNTQVKITEGERSYPRVHASA